MRPRDFVPPVVFQLVRKVRYGPTALSGHREIPYSSYEEAAAACSEYGYQQQALIDVVYQKTLRFRDRLRDQRPFQVDLQNFRTPFCLALVMRQNKALHVIDWGGACGAHFYTAKAFLGESVQLKWFVVETPTMVKWARTLETTELHFFDNLRAASQAMGNVDLVYASGALQYVRDPYQQLRSLVGLGSKYLFVTRLPLTTGTQDLVCVQQSRLSENGPGPLPDGMSDGVATYPMLVPRKTAIERILAESYSIRMLLNEDREAYSLSEMPINMYGFWCERS